MEDGGWRMEDGRMRLKVGGWRRKVREVWIFPGSAASRTSDAATDMGWNESTKETQIRIFTRL